MFLTSGHVKRRRMSHGVSVVAGTDDIIDLGTNQPIENSINCDDL